MGIFCWSELLFLRMIWGKERGSSTGCVPASDVVQLSWSRRRRAELPQASQTPLAQAVQADLPSKCHLLGVPASSLHQLSSWAQPNQGCCRCQQIPGNEHSLYRGLPSPTSQRETQQPLKFILKYVGFTQKAFMALCSNTWAVWAQDNAQRDTGGLCRI